MPEFKFQTKNPQNILFSKALLKCSATKRQTTLNHNECDLVMFDYQYSYQIISINLKQYNLKLINRVIEV